MVDTVRNLLSLTQSKPSAGLPAALGNLLKA